LVLLALLAFSTPGNAQDSPHCDYTDAGVTDPVVYCFQVAVTPATVVGGTSDLVHITLSVNPAVVQSEGLPVAIGDADNNYPLFFPSGLGTNNSYTVVTIPAGGTSVSTDAYTSTPITGTVHMAMVAVRQSGRQGYFFYTPTLFDILENAIVLSPDRTTVGPGGTVNIGISFTHPMRLDQTVKVQDATFGTVLGQVLIPAGGSGTFTYQAPSQIFSSQRVNFYYSTIVPLGTYAGPSARNFITLLPAHPTYTGTFSAPQTVVGGTALTVGATLSQSAQSGLFANIGGSCSNSFGSDFLYSAVNPDPNTFNFGNTTQNFSYVAHVYSQTATLNCSPYYYWSDDPTIRSFGSGYSIQITPPTLALNVAPNLAADGTLEADVSLSPANQYAVPFTLSSSDPNVIQSTTSTIPIGQTAVLKLQVNLQNATNSTITLTAKISTPTGLMQVTGTFVIANSAADTGVPEDCTLCAGEPINLSNGNTYIETQDYSLPGLGGGISIHRTWNSLRSSANPAAAPGMFGQGWRSTYEEQLLFPDLTHLNYWRSDGSTWSFLYANGSFALQSPANRYVNLTYDSTAAQYTLTYHDGSQKVFAQSGYLLAIRDRNGNATSLSYDSTNRIVQVTDASGRSLSFTYGDSKNPNQVTAITDVVGLAASYTYDNASRLLQVRYTDSTVSSYVYDSNSLLTSVLDNEGKVLEAHTYDQQFRGLTSQRAGGVDLVSVSYGTNGAAQIADSAGNTSAYATTKIANWGKVTSVSGTTCASCGAQGPVSYIYDGRANRTSTTDALGRTTSFTYDAFGEVLTRSIVVGGNTLTWGYTYDNLGNVLISRDPLGFTMTNVYDGRGNLLSTTTPAPDGAHSGSTTSFTYDSKGELVQVTDSRGNSTQMTYTPAGQIASATDTQGKVTQFQYDRRGNKTAAMDALGNVTTYTYDGRNQLTKVTNPDQTSMQYSYDSRGRRTSVIDPNGKTTSNAYDDADHLISVTDAAQQVTHYAYDTENNLTSITDALGRQTTFSYDKQRRVIQTMFPSGFPETYSYDAVGNLLTKTDRKQNTLSFKYDELDRAVQKQYPDTSAVQYAYDADSRTTGVTDATGTYQFAYDNMGRMTSAQVTYSFLPGKTFSVANAYDANSNRVGMTDPQGGVTSYTYDSNNRLVGLADPGANSFTFAYDALGRRTQLSRSNGNVTTYQYDSLSRLLAVLHFNGRNTIDGAQYTYDAAGNRTSKLDLLKKDTTTTYNYDNVYQLVAAALNGTTSESYSYDAVGNRLTSAGSSFNYNSSNELVSFTNSSGGDSYLFDADGNPTAKIESVGTTSYSWDFENRLVQVVVPGTNRNPATTVTFRYDPFGRRIQKLSPGATSNYIYDGANLLEELDATGNLVARYTHSTGVDEPLVAVRGADTRFYQVDGLGSVTSLSRDSGAISDYYVWDSYGNMTESHGNFTQPFGFTARELDSETGLMYFRDRYYDPAVGRFLNEDPSGFGGGKNFYAALNNKPTGMTDPFGRFPIPEHWYMTYMAARQVGLSLSEAQDYASKTADVDTRPNGQSPMAEYANMHAMAGLKPDGTWQTCSEAYQGAVASLANSIKGGDIGAALHLIEDQFSPSHAGFQRWDGGSTIYLANPVFGAPVFVPVLEHVPSVTHLLGDASFLWNSSSSKAENAAKKFLGDYMRNGKSVNAKNYINGCACGK
jgi:RHS repeat-associated protein